MKKNIIVKDIKKSPPTPPPPGAVMFEVEIPSNNYDFDLLHLEERNGVTFNYGYTIWWGDGHIGHVTSYDSPNRMHKYANAGVYTIYIDGICESIGASVSTQECLTKILSWGPTGGFKFIHFRYCTNLRLLPNEAGKLTNIQTIDFTFNDTGIVTVPDGLFKDCSNITGAKWNTFSDCNSLLNIGSEVFENADIPGITYTFQRCSNLVELDDRFLVGIHPNFKRIDSAFNRCDSLTTVPVGFLQPSIEEVNGLFSSCPSLVTVDVEILSSLSDLKSCAHMFKDCTSFTTGNLTCYYNGYCNNYESMFENTAVTQYFDRTNFNGSYPASLKNCYKNCLSLTNSSPSWDVTNIWNVEGLFDGCTNITNYADSTWWDGSNPQITDYANCFRDNTNRPNYADIPNDWKGL